MLIWNSRRICFKNIIIFILLVIIALVLWTPYHLKNWPLIIGIDGIEQIEMAVGDLPISNHHPVTFILFLRLMLGILMGMGFDLVQSLFIFSVLQSILMATIFSFVTLWCYKISKIKVLSIFIYLFLALPPFQGLYSITLWKDIWYGMACVSFLLSLNQCISERTDIKEPTKLFRCVMVFILGVCACCLRNNAIYAFLVLPVACFFLYRNRKDIIITLICIIFASFGLKSVENKYIVEVYDGVESAISIPLQNIGYLLANDYEISSADIELIKKVIDIERAKKEYVPYIADPMKEIFAESNGGAVFKANVYEYSLLWIRLGIRYPLAYVKSWYGQTSGYYIPDYQFRINIEGISESKYNLNAIDNRSSLIKELNDNYSLLWSPPFPLTMLTWESLYTWFVILSLIVAVVKRNKSVVMIDMFLATYLLTLFIAVPVNADFRYIYSIVLSVPIVISLLVSFRDRKIV